MTLENKSSGRKRYQRVAGAKKSRCNWVADFETTTDPDDCRVWAWGLTSVDDPEFDFDFDNNIDSFIAEMAAYNRTVYFHNLKFDGFFIIDWLLKNGFKHVTTNERDISPMTFKSLISDMGAFYSITVRWGNGHNTEFRDSLKKLPMPVSRIATSFKLDETKGDIDYHLHRPVGHVITPEELDYLKRDVFIVAKAMKTVIDSGMTKLTVASDSMAEYKRLTGSKLFARTFPTLNESMDAEIRRAYRGGWTYCDPRYSKVITRSGLVLDVNSLYPSVMMNNPLPYGVPEWEDGRVLADEKYPLTIFSVTFVATIKPKHLPCIQIKGHSIFGGTEYLTSIDEPVTLMVTNVDWELYLDHYDIEVISWGGGWKFKARVGMFDSYINKWSKIKAESEGGLREIAKLHLNALYGKFATNPHISSKIPTLLDNRVKLVRGDDETREPVYTPVGVFITSFARNLTIRAAQDNYDVFAYADTDSLHLLVDDVPEGLDIHPTRIGAWKLEYKFEAAYYIRPKAYLERLFESDCECGEGVDGHGKQCVSDCEHAVADKNHGEWCKYVARIAGLPQAVTARMTFADMVEGKVLTGKLSPKSVPGGVVLKDVPFKLMDVA